MIRALLLMLLAEAVLSSKVALPQKVDLQVNPKKVQIVANMVHYIA
jgi:hypothetical protein